MGVLLFNRGTRAAKQPIRFWNGRITWEGDSLIQGFYSSTTAKRTSSLVTSMLGGTENNLAEQGETMEQRTPDNPLGINDMIDRLAGIPHYNSAVDGLLVFGDMINDWGSSGAYPDYNPTNFIADYSTVLTYAINVKGWAASNIAILSASYVSDAAITFYNNYLGGNPPTRNDLLAFIAAGQTIATAFGARYIDTYTPMIGVDSILTGEGVHLNDAGHLLRAQIIYNELAN